MPQMQIIEQETLRSLGVSIDPTLLGPELNDILTPHVLATLARLQREFGPTRQELLQARVERQKRFDQGEVPQYEPINSEAVQGKWKVSPIPPSLLRRRVEITGPVGDGKMVINMLSRTADGQRADTAMLDFEDSMMPTWENVSNGFLNVLGCAKGDLCYTKAADKLSPEKKYKLNPQDMAVPMVRVRGLHLNESNVLIDGSPISAGLFDLTVCFLLTASILKQKGLPAKYYVPKCEHYLEARWWNKLFTALEHEANVEVGTLKCTFLIETLSAAFQMEEILYELRQHAVALNVGRWDKIFSDIKVLKEHADRISPDRARINMQMPWMENYALRLIKICHSRGAMAIGGMAAFTPGKDAKTREIQTNKVRADKEREFQLGHDGCWVSHPYFVGVAMQAFIKDNQLNVTLDDFDKYPDLLMQGGGTRTLQGLRTNIRVGVAYMRGWNQGIGCVAWDNLMEDLATLEISRAQTWQWLRHKVTLEDGEKIITVNQQLIKDIFEQELAKILIEVEQDLKERKLTENFRQEKQAYIQAKNDACEIFLQPQLNDFLTLDSPKGIFKGA